MQKVMKWNRLYAPTTTTSYFIILAPAAFTIM